MTAQATTKEKENGGAKKPIHVGDTVAGKVIQRIFLDEVNFDPAFNVRSAKLDKGVGDDGEEYGTAGGIDAISLSIEAEGQDTAALVRPSKKGKVKYDGVCGFRREEAIRRLAVRALSTENGHVPNNHPIASDPEWDARRPSILAVVRDMTDLEAYLANLRENTARDELRSPDFAFGLLRLQKAYEKENDGKTRGAAPAIALGLGKAQRHVLRLLDIMNNVDKDVLEDWRASQRFVPVQKMHDLSKVASPHMEQYLAFKAAKVETKPEASATAWLDKAKARAEEIGHTVGVIVEQTAMGATDEDGEIDEALCLNYEVITWDESTLRGLMKFKKTADGNEMRQITAAAKRGVKAGIADVKKAVKEAAAKKNNDDGEGDDEE